VAQFAGHASTTHVVPEGIFTWLAAGIGATWLLQVMQFPVEEQVRQLESQAVHVW